MAAAPTNYAAFVQTPDAEKFAFLVKSILRFPDGALPQRPAWFPGGHNGAQNGKSPWLGAFDSPVTQGRKKDVKAAAAIEGQAWAVRASTNDEQQLRGGGHTECQGTGRRIGKASGAQSFLCLQLSKAAYPDDEEEGGPARRPELEHACQRMAAVHPVYRHVSHAVHLRGAGQISKTISTSQAPDHHHSVVGTP
eukprot:scaffold278805_cov15-Tisochrysis_lutea.AAC.1